MRFFRYSRWDGTQEISPFDPEEVMENLADDLLNDGDVRNSLQRILQRGFQNRDGNRTMGMQQLMERLRQQREDLLAGFYRLGLDHLRLRTDEPWLEPLLEFFLHRKRRR